MVDCCLAPSAVPVASPSARNFLPHHTLARSLQTNKRLLEGLGQFVACLFHWRTLPADVLAISESVFLSQTDSLIVQRPRLKRKGPLTENSN